MKSVWIFFGLVSCILPRYLANPLVPSTHKDIINDLELDSSISTYEFTTVDPAILRMEQDLDNLYFMAKEKIRTQENVNANTVDIIRKLIDTNATGLLHNYPESCPASAHSNGIYTVNVTGYIPFPVYCETHIAGPGWTVIQRRIDGNLNFYRNWAQYKVGFGNISSEFFIGLDKLHAITASRPHELYIQLEDFDGNTRFARYDDFLISAESDSYNLAKLGAYSGDAGDSLRDHAAQKFSTFDNDNDGLGLVCSEEMLGAWWYGASTYCAYSNLNGLYLNENVSEGLIEKGLYWHHWKGRKYSYKSVQMMVRPRCPCSYTKYS